MADNQENDNRESGDQNYLGIVKVVVGLALVPVIVWLVFYSVYIANITPVVYLRDRYQDIFWKVESLVLSKKDATFPDLDPVYTITPLKSPYEYTNIYLFRGVFMGISETDYMLQVRGYDDKIYYIAVGENFLNRNSIIPSGYSIYDPEVEVINQNSSLIPGETKVGIMWDDDRSLYQIFRRYRSDPSIPLNQNSKLFFSLSNF